MGDGGNWRGFRGVSLDHDTRVMSVGQEVVHNLESVLSGWEVDSSHVHDRLILGRGVITQEGEDWDHGLWWNVDTQLVLPNGELLDVFRQTGHQISTVIVQGFDMVFVFVGNVLDWHISMLLVLLSGP